MANQIRDFEVAFSKCYTDGTDKFTKVILLNGAIQWFDASDIALSATPGGVLTICADVDNDAELIVLCDNNSGVITKFFRKYVFVEGGTVPATTLDLTLAGIAYTPTGTVSLCDSDTITFTPSANTSVANGTAVIVPANAKFISIVNLGVSGNGLTFETVVLTGGLAYTIPANVGVHEIGEASKNIVATTAVTITPGTNSRVFVSWLI
jgi:hypothetical protein